ncbi:MAG: hypothetical protein JRN21_09355 [Nitrososphaerota archaeon]|nr:hypothetical protein [Nitrososphaerota archaeon]
MEIVELKHVPDQVKTKLLNYLGFAVDKEGFVTKDGRRVVDKYSGEEVTMDNMDIMPGRRGDAVILDHNILSLASYFDEYGEI